MTVDPGAVGELALARLAEERSAAFVLWTSLGETELADADIEATGVTDFRTLETCTRQQRLASAIVRDGKRRARSSRSPLDRLILGGGMWLIDRLHAEDWHDYFYTDGQRWEQTTSGAWTQPLPAEPRRRLREGRDPTLALEALAAITEIASSTPGIALRDVLTTRLRAHADLTRIDDRLADFLDAVDRHRRHRTWSRQAPVTLWIDESGLARRVSYAPLPGDRGLPLWRTLELYDFGAEVRRPGLDQTH